MNVCIERLKTYREIALVLARSYMNHDRRKEKMTLLFNMIEREKEKDFYQRDTYASFRISLCALQDILTNATVPDELTHTGRKAYLWLFCDVCAQAIADIQRDNPEQLQPLVRTGALIEVDGQSVDSSGIPF